MPHNFLRVVFATAICTATTLVATAQTTWRSTLYPVTGYNPAAANLDTDKVLQDFSYAGYRSSEQAIPTRTGPLLDVTAAPYLADKTGTQDATAAIQAAITAAGALSGGGVVFLPAGTYRLSVNVAGGRNEALLLDKPNVVLRGAGVGQTFLLNTTTVMNTTTRTGTKAIIRVSGPWNSRLIAPGSIEVALSRDLTNTTPVIPVTSTAGFAPGNTVSARSDLTDAWITERGELSWLGYRTQLGSQLAFRRTVVSVDPVASTITVDAPIRFSLKLRDNARLARLSAVPIAEVGLEDFSIGNLQHPGTVWGTDDYAVDGTPAFAVHASHLIIMERARDCWLRRIQTYQPAANTTTAHLLSNGLLLRDSTQVTVESCVFQRPQYGGAGGNGYMFTTERSQECLFLNTEARFSRHGFSFKGMGTSGNVIHACVDGDTGYATGAIGAAGYATTGTSSDHHMWFSLANLVDTTTADASWFEAVYRIWGGAPIHGVTATHSVFWNLLGTSRVTTRMPATSTWVVRSDQGGHGYVIGTRGARTAVVTTQNVNATTGQSGPIDHVEGAGLGDTLSPFSLYQDQRSRRIGPSAALPGDLVLPFPANSAVITPGGFFTGSTPVALAKLQVSWAAAEAGVALTPQTGGGVSVRVPGPGTWTVYCDTNYAGLANRQSVRIIAAASAAAVTYSLLPVADTFIQDGTSAATNFGTSTTFSLKRDAVVNFNRRGLLRFDTSSLADALPQAARLRLSSTVTLASYTGWSVGVHPISGAWSETGVNWNNAPTFGTLSHSYAPSASLLDVVDISDLYFALGGASATQIELGLIVTAQSTNNVLSYASRSHATVASRPSLDVDAVPAATRFTSWIATYTATPANRRGPRDDADGDGLANILEMALGRNPATPDAATELTLDLSASTVSFVISATLPAYTRLQLEFSSNLQTWTSLAMTADTMTTLSDGRRRITVPVTQVSTNRFWRLRASPEGLPDWP